MDRLPRTAVVTSLATVAGGLFGGVFALLVGVKLGSTPRTDGFFAAFSVYSIVLILATSWKAFIVSSMVGTSGTFDAFDRLFGGMLLLFAGCGVLFAGFGDSLASLLTGHAAGPAHAAAREALLVLWPAAGGQLFAGLAATMLNVLGKNSAAGIFWAVGSLVSILALVVLEPTLRVDALATSLAIGTSATVGLNLLWLLRAGWRPSLRILLRPRLAAVRLLLYSSISSLVGQVFFAVSIAVAARTGQGAATVFSYAFFSQALVRTLVSLSLPVVLATPLAVSWDRTAASLRPYLDDTLRIGLVLLIPVVAAVVFLGDDVGNALLSKLSSGQVHEIVILFLIFSVTIVVSQVSMIESLALATLRRYGALALLSLGLLLVHLPLSLVAGVVGSLYAVAAAFNVTMTVRALALLRMIHGRAVGGVIWTACRDAAPVSLAGVACFGVSALAVRPESALGDALAFAAGLALFVVTTTLFLPTYRVLALRLVRAIRPPATNVRV